MFTRATLLLAAGLALFVGAHSASIGANKIDSVLGPAASQEECFGLVRNGSSQRSGRRVGDANPNALTALFSGELQFSLDLFKAVYQNVNANSKVSSNVFYSPFSVFSALLVAYFGANGATEQQLAQALGLQGLSKVEAVQAHKAFKFMRKLARDQGLAKYDFDVANRLYFDSQLSIRQCMKAALEDDIQTVNFTEEPEETRQKINAWVEQNTKGKISELLSADAINEQTRMAIVNAAYFKGQWATQFKAANTRLNTFTNAKESSVTNMMFQKGNYRHATSEELQAHVLEMSYLGDDVSFFVILPPEEGSLNETISRLNATTLKDALFSTFPITMEVGLPKFRMEQTTDLSKVLKSIGLTEIFDSADFSGFSAVDSLKITQAVHKAFIEVNEEGSEAAGATALADTRMARPVGPTSFICDRPFLFLIFDNLSESILFMGAFNNPKQ